MKRVYESGSKWALWRWTDVNWLGVLYLVRLHLLRWPTGSIMLHWILTPDPHEDPHDHPVSFLSITLRGEYVERLYLPNGLTRLRRQRIRLTPAETVHRIERVSKGGCLTLVFTGRNLRTWGFHTPSGVVDWRTYRKRLHG